MTATDRTLLAALYALSPREFERSVAQLLQELGYDDVRVQGGADDRGVDILCRDADGRRVAVQCKRYAPTATVSAITVQHLVGMAVKSSAARAMLVTTGEFTAPARKQARDFDIELIDGAKLASLIAAHPELVSALRVSPVKPIAEPEQPPVFVSNPIAERERPGDGCGLLFMRVVFPAAAIGLTVIAAQSIEQGNSVGGVFLLFCALVCWFVTWVFWRM